MFLLYCDGVSGQVAMPATRVGEAFVGERHYEIVNHFVVVDGLGNDVLAERDAREICGMPLYRLATPSEQETFTALQSGAIRESVPVVKKIKATENGG